MKRSDVHDDILGSDVIMLLIKVIITAVHPAQEPSSCLMYPETFRHYGDEAPGNPSHCKSGVLVAISGCVCRFWEEKE